MHLTKVSESLGARADRPALELVEISSAMEKAGVVEMCEHSHGEPLGEIVKAVYMAMEYERRDQRAEASVRIPSR